MGNDGGSIPRRNEMVREKKQDEKADRRTQQIAMTFSCALSKQPLRLPVVGDALGRLYNRESILEHLLNPKAFGDSDKICKHITSLKDVQTLTFKANPEYEKEQKGNGKKSTVLTFDDQPTAQFICPITGKEMNGNLPFEFIWTCGCVFSAQARKEMPDLTQCLVCSEPFDVRDIVPINSLSSEVLDTLQERVEERKLEKKSKKAKSKTKSKLKRKLGDNDEAEVSATLPSASVLEGKTTKVQKTLV
ncbi:Replication termination factor 2 [Coemansia erecta]|nr:Replication termination factor 2 [Coemansia erecta]